MKQDKFSIKARFSSFKFAFNGLKILLREEHNSRIHLLAAMLVVIAGFFLHLSNMEWIVVALCIGWVFAMEIINSAIENIADFVSPQKHEMIKKIKDLSAAAVLVSACTAAITGLIVFLPKIWNLLE